MRLLIVEDEQDIAEDLGKIFNQEGYVTDVVATVSQASAAILLTDYDLIVLDRLLPDGRGDDVVALFKGSIKKRPPILMLTAMGDVMERIEGLDAGADDYLVKPADSMELLARARALLRRPAIKADDVTQLGNVTYSHEHRDLSINGEHFPLPPGELRILEALLSRAGRVVQRDHLESSIYNYDDVVSSNSLDAQISRLRKRLTAGDAGVAIVAIRGVGYLIKSQ